VKFFKEQGVNYLRIGGGVLQFQNKKYQKDAFIKDFASILIQCNAVNMNIPYDSDLVGSEWKCNICQDIMTYSNSLSCNHHCCGFCTTKILVDKVIASPNPEELALQVENHLPVATCPLCRQPIVRSGRDIEYQALVEKHIPIKYLYDQRQLELSMWKVQNME